MEPEFSVTYLDRTGQPRLRFIEPLEAVLQYAKVDGWTDVHVVYRFNDDIHYRVANGELVRLPPPRHARPADRK